MENIEQEKRKWLIKALGCEIDEDAADVVFRNMREYKDPSDNNKREVVKGVLARVQDKPNYYVFVTEDENPNKIIHRMIRLCPDSRGFGQAWRLGRFFENQVDYSINVMGRKIYMHVLIYFERDSTDVIARSTHMIWDDKKNVRYKIPELPGFRYCSVRDYDVEDLTYYEKWNAEDEKDAILCYGKPEMFKLKSANHLEYSILVGPPSWTRHLGRGDLATMFQICLKYEGTEHRYIGPIRNQDEYEESLEKPKTAIKLFSCQGVAIPQESDEITQAFFDLHKSNLESIAPANLAAWKMISPQQISHKMECEFGRNYYIELEPPWAWETEAAIRQEKIQKLFDTCALRSQQQK